MPAPAVIPAPIVYSKVVVVKTLVFYFGVFGFKSVILHFIIEELLRFDNEVSAILSVGWVTFSLSWSVQGYCP